MVPLQTHSKFSCRMCVRVLTLHLRRKERGKALSISASLNVELQETIKICLGNLIRN